MVRFAFTVHTKQGGHFDANHLAIVRGHGDASSTSYLAFESSGQMLTIPCAEVTGISFGQGAVHCPWCDARIDSVRDYPITA
jgi:hypothetical protein